MQLTAPTSAAVLMSGGIGAIEVGILAAHDAAVFVVRVQQSLRHPIPLVSHDLRDAAFGDRTALAASLLPVVEQCIVQRTQALGRVGRHE